jgi:hypothetical protein
VADKSQGSPAFLIHRSSSTIGTPCATEAERRFPSGHCRAATPSASCAAYHPLLQKARYYGAGEWVHPIYQIRQGHEIGNIEIAKLIPPKDWIRQVT